MVRSSDARTQITQAHGGVARGNHVDAYGPGADTAELLTALDGWVMGKATRRER
jgi:hypothetical protein